MKRKDNDETLGNVISRLLKLYRLEEGVHSVRIVQEWENIMGPSVAKYTQDIQLQKERLIITLTSAPLRHELSFNKEKIRCRLNESFGSELIKEVVLR